jgi:D-alanine transaminase
MNSLDNSICYLNGRFLPLAEAQVSVLDRGFVFGDGVYEVVPVFEGRPYRLEAHLARLRRSLDAIDIEVPYDDEQWRDILHALIVRATQATLTLYLQITRGVAPRNHAAPTGIVPTVFAMASPLDTQANCAPVAAVSLPDIRWLRCDIKAVSLLPNVMARSAAAFQGAYEALLFRDERLTEGAASNVFVVSGNRICTAPHSPLILPGITRDALVEALRADGEQIIEEMPTRAEVEQADEIWLSSSSRDIVPVGTLDGRALAAPGPVYRRVSALFARWKQRELAGVAPVQRG